MTPLEKALQEEGRVNYCDECEQFQIVGNAAYCKVDGKLIHPIMLTRGQGTGPAWNCKKRQKPMTNADRIRSMTDEELADVLLAHKCKGCDWDGGYCGGKAEIACRKEILLWLKGGVSI